MIFPDFEKMNEERICLECYGYTKGGALVPFVASMSNPIAMYFSFLSHCTAAAGKVALSTSFWLMSMQILKGRSTASALRRGDLPKTLKGDGKLIGQ